MPKKKKTKKGMHKMPNGRMMKDSEMKKYHKTKGKSWVYKMSGGRMR